MQMYQLRITNSVSMSPPRVWVRGRRSRSRSRPLELRIQSSVSPQRRGLVDADFEVEWRVAGKKPQFVKASSEDTYFQVRSKIAEVLKNEPDQLRLLVHGRRVDLADQVRRGERVHVVKELRGGGGEGGAKLMAQAALLAKNGGDCSTASSSGGEGGKGGERASPTVKSIKRGGDEGFATPAGSPQKSARQDDDDKDGKDQDMMVVGHAYEVPAFPAGLAEGG